MFNKYQISAALGIATVAWAIVLSVQGVGMTWHDLAPFSTVVSVLVGAGFVMDKFLWHVPIFQGWLFSTPDLRGTWRVTIRSEWVDPETGQRAAPITSYAAITQTLSKLQIHLMTPESESCLLAHSIEATTCGNRFQIAVVYANTPNVALRGVRSERHVGAAIINSHGEKKYLPIALEAEYWTDRKSVGRMTFENRVSKIFSRYEDALANYS
ncbi:MAG: hypothetical protein P4L92_17870 [Rudaea sp.]|nr:hypothetical protein [Rudaea sp.]